jgi:hypothetical protein
MSVWRRIKKELLKKYIGISERSSKEIQHQQGPNVVLSQPGHRLKNWHKTRMPFQDRRVTGSRFQPFFEAIFQPINNVSLETYANLLALMSDVCEDEAACLRVAEANGVAREDWEAATAGWTARMRDAAKGDRVSHAFLKVYGSAMSRRRDGGEPISLEEYARILASLSLEKDLAHRGRPIDRDKVLRQNNLTARQGDEILLYWAPKVSDKRDTACQQFLELIERETERIAQAA